MKKVRAHSPAVLDGLSLSLATGSIGWLLSPSGYSKMKVLLAIAGFEPFRAGRSQLDGSILSAPGTHRPPNGAVPAW